MGQVRQQGITLEYNPLWYWFWNYKGISINMTCSLQKKHLWYIWRNGERKGKNCIWMYINYNVKYNDLATLSVNTRGFELCIGVISRNVCCECRFRQSAWRWMGSVSWDLGSRCAECHDVVSGQPFAGKLADRVRTQTAYNRCVCGNVLSGLRTDWTLCHRRHTCVAFRRCVYTYAFSCPTSGETFCLWRENPRDISRELLQQNRC